MGRWWRAGPAQIPRARSRWISHHQDYLCSHSRCVIRVATSVVHVSNCLVLCNSQQPRAALQRLAILAALQRLVRPRSALLCSVWLFALLCSVYGTGVLAALQRWTSVVNCVMSFPGLTVLGIRLPADWTQAKIDRAHAKVATRRGGVEAAALDHFFDSGKQLPKDDRLASGSVTSVVSAASSSSSSASSAARAAAATTGRGCSAASKAASTAEARAASYSTAAVTAAAAAAAAAADDAPTAAGVLPRSVFEGALQVAITRRYRQMLEDTAVHRMFQLTRFVRDNGRLPLLNPPVGDAAQRTLEKSMYYRLRMVKDWVSAGDGAGGGSNWSRGEINWYRNSATFRSAYAEFAALQQSRDRPLTVAENSKLLVLRDKVKPWVTRERRMPPPVAAAGHHARQSRGVGHD